MGLFGKLLGREGAQKNEAAEAPKAEAAEVKGAKETGKERVDKMLEASKAAKNAVMTKTGNVLARVGGAMRDAFFATIGGVEKGATATAKYVSETKTEAGQIVTSGIDAGNKLDTDVGDFLKTSAMAGVDALNKFGDWAVSAEKELKEKAPGVHADIQSRAEKTGLQVAADLGSAVMEGLKQFEAFKKWMNDAKTEFAKKRSDVHQDIIDRASAKIEPFANPVNKFAENVINVPRDAQKELDNLLAKAKEAKDRFEEFKNTARLGLAKAAELAGEFASIPDRVSRLESNIDSQERLSTVVPESTIVPESKETVDKSFVGQTTVNNIDIIVEWDKRYDDYVVYLPQIEPSDEAREKGVADQLIRVTRRADVAKQVFDFTVKTATSAVDQYDLYKKVEAYSKGLPYEIDHDKNADEKPVMDETVKEEVDADEETVKTAKA